MRPIKRRSVMALLEESSRERLLKPEVVPREFMPSALSVSSKQGALFVSTYEAGRVNTLESVVMANLHKTTSFTIKRSNIYISKRRN